MRTARLAATLLALALFGCSSEAKKPENGATGGTSGPLAPEPDKRDFLEAVLLAPWPKDGVGLKPGFWVEERTTAGGNTTTKRIAIVAEAGDLVKLEQSASDNALLGYTEGLTVQKATGKIVEAVAAKKGDKAKPIKIRATEGSTAVTGPATAEPPKTPATSDESVTVPAGTFAATKLVVSGALSDTTTWIAKEGDAKGLVVKWADDVAGSRELKSVALEDAILAGKSVKAVHAIYSDASEEWWVRDLTVPFYGQPRLSWLKRIRAGATTELAWGEDAKPEIDWTN